MGPRIAQALTHLTKRASEETCGICRAWGIALPWRVLISIRVVLLCRWTSPPSPPGSFHAPARERRDLLFEEFDLWSDYDAYARPSGACSCPVAAGAITTQSRSIRLPFWGA